ncbi:MAG: hypothetical protein ACE5IO_10445 [Thermoplasmata archaeon]
MTEASDKTKSSRRMSRHRIGRAVLWIGVVIIGVATVLTIVVMSAAAITGSDYLVTDYGNIAIPLFLLGIAVIVVGLVMTLLPRGLSRDGVSILKTGPYLR